MSVRQEIVSNPQSVFAFGERALRVVLSFDANGRRSPSFAGLVFGVGKSYDGGSSTQGYSRLTAFPDEVQLLPREAKAGTM